MPRLLFLFALLVGLVVAPDPFFNQTWFRPIDHRRAAYAEYVVSDGRQWSWTEIITMVQRLDAQGNCVLGAVTQTAQQTLFVVACLSPPTSPADVLGVQSGSAALGPNGVVTITTGQQNGAPWHLDRIDNFQSASYDNIYHYFGTGSPSTGHIYIIDTGIRATHHEFDTGRASFVANTIDADNTDCNGHGTFTASLAVGTTYGVAKSASIKAIKALDCDGMGTVYTVSTALAYVQAQCTSSPTVPIVVSMSLSGSGSSIVDNAVTSLQESCHVSIAVAAGNAQADACGYSPGRVANCLTVGASTPTDARAYYSNFGNCVDLLAPGGDGGANPITGAGTANDNALVQGSGTSMATPLVAGTASILMAQRLGAGFVLGNDNFGLLINQDIMTHRSKGTILFAYFDDASATPPAPAPPGPAPPPAAPPPPPPGVGVHANNGQTAMLLSFLFVLFWTWL